MVRPPSLSADDYQKVGVAARTGYPVLVDIGRLGPAEARSLVDYCMGLVFALHGTALRLDGECFVLVPAEAL